MSAVDTWVSYLAWHALLVREQFIHLRGRKQRKRAIARLYPLPPDESNGYRRHVWTRVCRAEIEIHRQRRRPGHFRLIAQ